MTAHTTADLLSDAFTCSGSVTTVSAPWKAQAIGNLEARLAVAMQAARQREVYGSAERDPAVIDANKRECQQAVYDALPDCCTYFNLCQELDYPAPYIQAALRNLCAAGLVVYTRRGDNRTYAQAAGATIQCKVVPSGTWMLAAQERACAAKKAKGIKNRAKIAEMYGVGLSAEYIAAQVGLSLRRVREVILEIKKAARQ